MKIKYNIILSLMLMCSLTSQAKPRTQEQMAQAAGKAISAHFSRMHKVPRQGQLQTLDVRGHLTVMGYAGGGFAIVTADDLLPEVVGCSEKTYDTAGGRNDAFQWWLSAMQEAAAYYISNNVRAHIVKPNTEKYLPEVRPLLSTEWGQEEPFNNACPMLPDDELYPRHCVVGCVATATAQILNYHQYPATGQGTTTLQVPYGDPTGTSYAFDFSACNFDWSHMRNTYTQGNYTDEEAQAVANLSHAMGMMAVMQYGLDFSGAISDDAADGLNNYFGIETAQLVSRQDLLGFSDNYTEEQWCDMVFNELSNVGPLYYAGADANNLGGHAFVIDGYNADGLVHVNWGWHGRFDGYYDVSILDPRIYHFSKQQEMILGIAPPAKAKGITHVITVDVPGTLQQLIEQVNLAMGGNVTVSGLKVSGTLNDADIRTMANLATLKDIDIQQATLQGDRLPEKAFYGCSNLRSLLLPETMTSIGDGALANCSNLNTIELPSQLSTLNYQVKDGVLYTKDMKEVIMVLPTTEDEVEIAGGVTAIHDYALEGCKYVRNVTLPTSLTTIGQRALANMPVLRELRAKNAYPATVAGNTFDGVDPGFLLLRIPAGSRPLYAEADGWKALFRSDNVQEVGTIIRARDLTRNYGEETDEYYFEMIGERVSGMPKITCAATKTSPAGEYPIVVERGSITSDNVTYVNGTLTIVGGPVGSQGNDAEAQTLALGYCNGEVSTETNWGGQGNNYTSAAIFIPASMVSNMVGSDIVAIRAGLSTRLNIDELTVWVRSSLDGENLADGVLNRKQTRVQQGWNEVSLSEPYSITGEGFYIGYTYHHTSVSRAVSFVGTTPEGTAFYKESNSSQWQDKSSEGAVSIEALVSGASLPQYDLALTKATITPALNAQSSALNYQVKAEVANMATNSVDGFSITVSGEGIDDVTTHVAQSIESGKQATVAFAVSAQHASLNSLLQVTISSIDNATDENLANNTVEAQCAAFQRNVLVEEFTTERCPNCPSGAERMNDALHANADYADRVFVVCHHSAFGTDWLTQPCDEDYVWMFNEGGQAYAPAWMINRQGRYDQNIATAGEKQAIYFISDSESFAKELDGELLLPTHLLLGATASASDGQVNVRVVGMRDDAFNLPNALLTVYLTEDNVVGKQSSSEGTIDPYQHQHVIRAYNSSWGDDISWEDDGFEASYTFDLDPTWKLADLKVVALVANYDATDNLNCTVENVTAAPVQTATPQTPTGILAKHCDEAAPHHQYYDLQGRVIGQASHRGIAIVKRADGTVRKVVNR